MRTSSTKNSLIIGFSIVLGASLLSVGVSNAAGSTIKACAKKSNGAMRLISNTKNCEKNERTLTWGTKGASGAKGKTGSTGTSGISFATYTTKYNDPILGADPAPYTVASLDNLTSGNYLLQASLALNNRTFLGNIQCRFYAEVSGYGALTSQPGYIYFVSPTDEQGISLTYAVEDFPGGEFDKIDFQCRVNGTGDVQMDRVYMSATKVDTLLEQL